ncbi:MAG TPA: hypothetical protein VE756_08940 [Burkholderiales bacterium]|jgi:hypothetical protein|nr:hypothetical protein [Burkholderiales bacterium]
MAQSELLDTLFKANAEAAAQGEYEVAYHTLMAALHLADRHADLRAVERINLLARQQQAMVEAVQPPHNLSSAQAKNRGQTPLFESLRIHIDSVRLRHESLAAFKRAKASSAG